MKGIKSEKDEHTIANKYFNEIKDCIISNNPNTTNADWPNLNEDKLKKHIESILEDNPTTIKNVILLRVIADYISGMTDRLAEKKYNEIYSSSTQWSKEYSEMGTFNV